MGLQSCCEQHKHPKMEVKEETNIEMQAKKWVEDALQGLNDFDQLTLINLMYHLFKSDKGEKKMHVEHSDLIASTFVKNKKLKELNQELREMAGLEEKAANLPLFKAIYKELYKEITIPNEWRISLALPENPKYGQIIGQEKLPETLPEK
jgi:hypothetical protein